MRLVSVCVLLAFGCGDDGATFADAGNDTCVTSTRVDNACTEATEYLGAIVTCDQGAGVCIPKGERAECLPLCNDDDDDVCSAGRWHTTTAECGVGVCYCE